MIYKILLESEWAEFRRDGVFRGSLLDKKDGFIHFSTAGQTRQTAEKYFLKEKTIVLVEVDPGRLPQAPVWEQSGRGLFPHLYEDLPMRAVVRSWIAFLDLDGRRIGLPPVNSPDVDAP